MIIFLKHIFRNIKENIGRTSMIMISLFGLGLIISISLSILFSVKSLFNSMKDTIIGDIDYLVYSSTDENITLDRIKETNFNFIGIGIPKANFGYIYNEKSKKENINDKYEYSPLIGVDLKKLNDINILDVENIDNIQLKENEVILSDTLVNKLNLKINDTFVYYDEDGKKINLILKYIAKSSGVFLQNVSIVTSEDNFKKINGEDEIVYDYICVKYKGKDKIKDVSKLIYSVEDDYGLDFISLNKPNLIDLFNNVLKLVLIIGILILVVVFFNLNSIVKIIMNERIPVVGTFRSVGASSKKMYLILLGEMSMYGLVSGIFSSFAGVAFIKQMFAIMEMMDDMLGVSLKIESLSKYNFFIIIFTIIFLILFQLLLSVAEIIRINKLSIKDSIFNKHESIYNYSKIKFLFGSFCLIISLISITFGSKLSFFHNLINIICIFVAVALLTPIISLLFISLFKKNISPVFQIVKNTVIKNKLQIYNSVIVAVMLSISLISFSAINYLIKDYKFKLNAVESDIYVSSSFEPVSIYNEISAIDGVDNVGMLYYTNIKDLFDKIIFANHTISDLNILYSYDYKVLSENSNIINLDYNKANKLKNNEVILNDYFKIKYNLKIGDVITINAIEKTKRFPINYPINLKIVDFMDANRINNMSIILSEKMVNDLTYKHFSNNKFYVKLSDKNKAKSALNEIRKKLTYNTFEVYNKEDYIKEIQKNIKGMYGKIIIVLGTIIGVSLIGISNNQMVIFLERKKELAVMYSIGMSRKQIDKMIIQELALSYSISSVISLFVTTILSISLKNFLNSINFYFPIKISILGLFILVIVVLIILIVIYNVMHKKIKKMNIVEELKYE